jgi:hypothetical protein
MSAVHFVERKNNVHRVPDVPGEWESGYWVIAQETAQRLIGADLYLHSGQNEPSHFGGKIVAFRTHRSGPEIDGRIVFRIRATPKYKGVVTGREGWGNEKKLVW